MLIIKVQTVCLWWGCTGFDRARSNRVDSRAMRKPKG